MNFIELIEKIKFIEQNFDVNKLQYQNVKIWPLIRYNIIYTYYFSWKPRVSSTISLKKRVLDTFYTFKEYLKYIKIKKIPKKNIDAPNLFLSRNSSRMVQIGDKYINPFYEPIKDFLLKNNLGLSASVEIALSYPNFLKGFTPFFLANRCLNWCRFRAYANALVDYLVGKKSKYDIHNYEEFTKFCNDNQIKLRYNYSALQEELLNIIGWKNAWKKIIESFKAKNIFLDNFDQPVFYAACLAAKEMGVNAIEVQHGMIGDTHTSYAQWHRLPESGSYEMLPTHYWCWGRSFANVIQKHLLASENNIIIGGNLWLNDWINQGSYSSMIDSCNFSKDNRKKILLSLHPDFEGDIEKPHLPVFLIEALKELNSQDFAIIGRLHPMMQGKKDKANQKFNEIGLEVEEIHEAQEKSLYSVLKRVDINITTSSTTSIEALAFNVPTIIVDIYGKSNYKEAIENQAFLFAQTKQEVQKIISDYFSGILKVNFQYVNQFFQKDEALIVQELKKIY